MLLFHSIYTPVSCAGVNPVPTPPGAAVFYLVAAKAAATDWDSKLDPSKSGSSLSCQNPIDCLSDQTSFSTKPLTTRSSLTGEDVGGMRESEARNAEERQRERERKKEDAGRRGRKRRELKTKDLFSLCHQNCAVFSCEENMETACLYPVDGGSLQ